MLPLAAPLLVPFTTAHFVLAIDGLISVSFNKCTGLASEVSTEDYQEGGENRYTHRFPIRSSFPNLVLTQGAGPLQELWDWYGEYQVSGHVAPRNGTITLTSAVEGVMEPVRVWSFTRGWPVKLTGPDLDAQASAVAVESVEIAHHGLALKKLGI
ncbi:phage tail protein [Nocardioides immobilis]|uniref:Phage tail protein n=1 Tax=Nocardioides immobilis TaxID=2049295 RepID=A0A417XSD5_9ACTN|nr:phage tail protein [Nocardioides immobilis]RHW23358.1 phage tail protein [Nocardioides immobilis]